MSRTGAGLVAAMAMLDPRAAAAQQARDCAVLECPGPGPSIVDDFRDGRWDQACSRVKDAVRLEPSRAALWAFTGRCREHSGKLAGAWEAYTVAAFHAKAAGDEPRRVAFQGEADRLVPLLSALVVRLESGLPPEAELSVDGEVLKLAAPDPKVFVDAGRHQVILRLGQGPNDRRWSLDVEMERGASRTVNVALPTPAPKPVAPFVVGGVGLGVLAGGGALAGLSGRGRGYQIGGIASLATGVGMVGAGIGLFVRATQATEPSPISVGLGTITLRAAF